MNCYRYWRAVLLVISLVVPVACVPVAPSPSSTSAPQGTAPTAVPTVAAPVLTTPSGSTEGKTLTFIDGPEPTGLYPPTFTGPPGTLNYLMFEPLVGHNEKMEPDASMGLATSWTIGDDKVTWTFKLRQGVKFHDGTDFDANAVKVTLDTILDPKTGALRRSNYTIIKEVKVVDPLTVQIITTDPFPDMPFLLIDRTSFIVSPTALKKYGVADFALHPVGTGPFKFVEWKANDHITVEAFPDYWRGKPKLSRVIYRPVPEPATRTAMLRRGEADIALNISPDAIASLKSDPNIDVLLKDSMTQVTAEMKVSKPPFSIKEVRQAMNYAIDSSAIVKNIMNGIGRVADSPAPPNAWGSVSLTPYSYNPQKAKELLTKAGYPNGIEIHNAYVSGRWAGDDQVMEALQAYWQAVGIKVTMDKMDLATLIDRVDNKDPDLVPGWISNGIRTSRYLDYHLWRLFSCGGQNFGYCNRQVHDLLVKARSSFDEKERLNLYTEAQKQIWDDSPFIWVFNTQNVLGARKSAKGYEFLPVGDLLLFSADK